MLNNLYQTDLWARITARLIYLSTSYLQCLIMLSSTQTLYDELTTKCRTNRTWQQSVLHTSYRITGFVSLCIWVLVTGTKAIFARAKIRRYKGQAMEARNGSKLVQEPRDRGLRRTRTVVPAKQSVIASPSNGRGHQNLLS